MKKTLATSCLAALLVAGMLNNTRAEVPSGNYSLALPAALTLIDPSGGYSESLSGVWLELTLNCDLAGKITGTGVASGSEFGVDIDLALTCAGSISGNNRAPRLKLVLKGSGTAAGGGMRFPVSLDLTFGGPFDPGSGQFTGAAKGKACVVVDRKKQCESMKQQAYFEPEETGVMTLGTSVNLTTDRKNRTVGTGVVSLSNGRQFSNFKVTGKYTPKKDQAQLTVSATDRSGAKLSITAQPQQGALGVTKISGKALGQSLKL